MNEITALIGKSIGPYQILAELGRGGMGEVYRARDTKLDRDVAIKVLPESFAMDADRLARFTRGPALHSDGAPGLQARGIPLADVLPVAKSRRLRVCVKR